MTNVVVVSGSPSPSSRTLRLVRYIGARLRSEAFSVSEIEVRALPAEDLLFARATSPALAAPLARIESADGLVVGTPIYKAAYSGVLKTFLDLLPPRALAEKIIFPIATGAAPTHALALDYALRPVLMALGEPLVLGGLFVFDKHIGEGEDESVVLEPDAERQVAARIAGFANALRAAPIRAA
jgi:FMN reductase